MSSDFSPEISEILPALSLAKASRPGRRLDFPPQLDREFFPTPTELPRPVQTIEDSANSCKQHPGDLSRVALKAFLWCPLPTLRDQNGSKFKTLCVLMTKISTGTLITISILTLHE